jgi:DNA mismatch endonuclease (patch repair protein)
MDIFSKKKRRSIMQAVRRTETAPEESFGRLLDEAGCDYLKNVEHLPGKPDFVLPTKKIALFVHGCFWHGHDRCRKGRNRPKSNGSYWHAKIERNKCRDRRAASRLRRLGYSVLTFWECDLRTQSMPHRLSRLLETKRK